MRHVWKILILFFLAPVLLACQSAPASTPRLATQTDAPESPTGNFPAGDTTQTPTLPEEDASMTPVTPPNESAERMVSLVKQHLSQRLNITADQIVLSDIKPVVWRDAGLGCPKPNIDYLRVETPGYNILLEASGKTYRYHTDKTKRFVQCNK